MKRTLMGFTAMVMALSTVAQAEDREVVSTGEVVAVSAKDGTLKVREIAESPEDARPGTMQSGVEGRSS